MKNPYDYFKVNTMVTLNVFEACRELGIKKAIIMSSFSPYGKAPCPITEYTLLNPNNPYGGSKENVETIAKVYAQCFGIKTIIFRVPLICGEGQKEMNAVREFVASALKGNKLEIWGDGSTLREFLHPEDVARAYLNGLTYLRFMNEPYNTFVLGNEPIAMMDLAWKVVNIVGKGETHLLSDKPRLFDQYTSRDRARILLGWTPRIGIDEIVRRVVKDMRE